MIIFVEKSRGITKEQILGVCRWLWNMCFEEIDGNA
jgi:hypothetical protein